MPYVDSEGTYLHPIEQRKMSFTLKFSNQIDDSEYQNITYDGTYFHFNGVKTQDPNTVVDFIMGDGWLTNRATNAIFLCDNKVILFIHNISGNPYWYNNPKRFVNFLTKIEK